MTSFPPEDGAITRISLDHPRLYLNRHLQRLALNYRVLEEARDPGNPLPRSLPGRGNSR